MRDMGEQNLPLVSIGVASFNNARYIIETLDSIAQLDYSNLELIVVDDVSSDNSVSVVQRWMAGHPELPATLIVNPVNKGLCGVCNVFIGAARGKYVSLIGSDDIFVSDKLARQVPVLEAASANVAVVYSDISRIDAEGNVILAAVFGTGLAMPYEGDVWLQLLRLNFVQAMGVLVRRESILAVGGYDESLAYEDWDMWLRLARQYKFVYEPGVVAKYRIHGSSISSTWQSRMAESSLHLLQKHIGVSAEGDGIIREHTAHYAEVLYLLAHPDSAKWLTRRWQAQHDIRSLALLMLARLGIPARRMSQVSGVIKRLMGRDTLSIKTISK